MHHLLHSCSLLLLLFNLSLASLQLSSSSNTNGSYCPGKVTFTCLGISVPIGVSWRINGSIIHAYTYTFTMNDIFPKVVFMSDNVIITVKSAAFIPPSTHNVTVELSGNVSHLLQSTVSCRTATQESDSFSIFLTVPEIPDNIRVNSVYNFFSKSLSEINIFWNTSNELCMDYSYQVMLTNGSSTLRSENVNCRRDTECQVTFMIATSQIFDRYIIQVITLDFQGLAVNTSILPPIDYISSFLLNISVAFSTCFIRCYSDSNVSGTCKIDFSEGSVCGTLNAGDIQIPESLQSGIVHFNATFNIDERTYIFRNSSDLQYNKKWTTEIQIYVILTPVLCIPSFILLILSGVCLHKRKADKKCLSLLVIITCIILLLSIIFLLVSLCCWIAGLIEVTKTDNCGSVDTPQIILIAALIFSFLTLILDATSIAFVLIYHPPKKIEISTQLSIFKEESWQKEEEVEKWQYDKTGRLVDEHGNKAIEGNMVSSGHRKIGEKLPDARNRVIEERTHKAMKLKEKKENVDNSEPDSNVYSQTKHDDPSRCQKRKTRSSTSYSDMGQKPTESPEDGHYTHLRHDCSATEPPESSLQESFLSQSAPVGCSYMGKHLSELPPSVNRTNTDKSETSPEHGKLVTKKELKKSSNAG